MNKETTKTLKEFFFSNKSGNLEFKITEAKIFEENLISSMLTELKADFRLQTLCLSKVGLDNVSVKILC